MPVEQDFSFVPDSTMSPSPINSPVIKRATRTYGKRRDVSLDDNDASSSTADQSFSSDTTISRTAPTDVDEEIPPSSDASFSPDRSFDAETPSKESASKDFFGWKRWAKEDGNTPPRLQRRAYDASIMDPSSSMERETGGVDRNSSFSSLSSPVGSPTRALCPESVATANNSPLSLPLITTEAPAITSFSNTSHSTPPRAINTSRNRLLGSHSEHQSKATPTHHTSPISVPTSVDTSKTRTSSTPPTSDNEMPVQVALKAQSKWKSGTRRSVPPLTFQEDQKATSTKEISTKKKIKAPTKKDDRERIKGQARIIAEQPLSIQKADNRNKYRVEQLFLNVKEDKRRSCLKSHPSSDPIIPFSSPSLQRETDTSSNSLTRSREENNNHAESPTRQHHAILEPVEELPSTKQFHVEEEARLEKEERRKRLSEMKKRVMEDQPKQTGLTISSDDEELDVVASQEMKSVIKREDAERKSGRKSLSKAQKKHLTFVGNKIKSPRRNAVPSNSSVRQRLTESASSHQSLSKFLVEQVQKQNMEAVKQKEEEWVKRGGKPVKHLAENVGSTKEERLNIYAEKALQKLSSAEQGAEDEGDDIDLSDNEWVPGGSESEQAHPDSDGDDQEHLDDDEALTGSGDDEKEEESVVKSRRSRHLVVDSDDEETENIGLAPSSSEESAEDDENNKENDTRFMFDRSEDKENKAVVRHSQLRGGPAERRLSLSPPNVLIGDDFDDTQEERVPLGAIISPKDLGSPVRPRNLTQEFAELRPPTPSPLPSLPASLSLAPVMKGDGSGMLFSQFSDEEPVPVSGGLGNAGIDDLFSPSLSLRVDKSRDGLKQGKLSIKPSLGLTQDVKLQPAFHVDEKLLQQADTIFEKEQEYLVEAANKKPQKQPELYVNDLGFLTQTRPEVSTPEVYRPPALSERFGWSPGASEPSTSRRAPLRTLSLTSASEFDSPDVGLKRLRKGRSPSVGGSLGSPRPVQNAFTLLAQGAANASRIETRRKLLEKSEFVEAEAEESDEDDVFGFAKSNDDEEDNDEDQDKTLEALVDDQEMDDTMLAADLVMEKFKEQEEVDDAKLEQYHQAVINGEVRKKRRHGGLGLDDSGDESDEDEENKRIRRGMHKKQKIDRGDIKALAGDETTKAFYMAYEQGVIDEDESFAHLQTSESQQDNTMKVDVDTDDEDDQEDEGFVTRSEIQRRARELVERRDQINPEDVSWIDADSDGEQAVRVKAAATKTKTFPRRNNMDIGDGEGIETRESITEVDPQRVRQKLWYNQEKHSKHGGIARRTEGTAVTGHNKGKSKTKSGGGSLPGRPQNAEPKPAGEPKNKLRPQASVLAGVDRSARFV